MKTIGWTVVLWGLVASAAWAQTTALDRMAQLANNAEFRTRVEYLIVKSAVAVSTEDATTCCYPPGVTHETATEAQKAAAQLLYTQRQRLAARCLFTPRETAHFFALAVATNAAITTASTDADLEFTVNSMWNTFARGGAM